MGTCIQQSQNIWHSPELGLAIVKGQLWTPSLHLRFIRFSGRLPSGLLLPSSSTAVLTILFLRFGDKAIKVASMMLLSALISFGAGYFACAAYVLLSGNQTAWGQALRANGAVALGVPSAALAAFALVVVLPAVTNEPVRELG